MELRFTSGQVCKIFSITKQTLLFYDKMDILKPKYVDRSSSYRYYTLDQFNLLYLILSLKETGLSLKEIKCHLTHRTLEKTTDLLENQIDEIQDKIANLETMKGRLQKSLTRIKQVETVKRDDEFNLKYFPEQYLLSMPVQFSTGSPNYTLTLSRIKEHIAKRLSTSFWDVGCISTFDPSGKIIDGEMFVVMDNRIEDEYFKLKPPGWYLCTYHYGEYSTLDITYKNLFDYMKSEGFNITGDLYENYIVDILNTADQSNFITELSIAIPDVHIPD